MTVRLDKYLANLGVCSRRDVKALLTSQNVTVNGERVRESGTRIDPDKDDLRLNGKTLQAPKLVYYLLNKPKGIISTTDDEFDRKDVTTLVPSDVRLYPVGRLDKDTTGLIFLTNDGDLTNLLTHPRYHVDKTYCLVISGKVTREQLKALRTGVLLTDGITSPAEVKVVKETAEESVLQMTIHEGKNRQIRRMCETVGIELTDLERVRFGPLEIGNLKSGSFRELSEKEVEGLRTIAKE